MTTVVQGVDTRAQEAPGGYDKERIDTIVHPVIPLFSVESAFTCVPLLFSQFQAPIDVNRHNPVVRRHPPVP